MATLQERPEAPEWSVPPRRTGRAISFAGQIRAPSLEDESDAVDSPRVGAGRKLSHTGSIQVRTAVAPMAQRKTHAQGHNSRVDAPSHLWSTINPQYTIEKARELYGGAPRPLSARHTFIRQAFLSDTEDWRSNAHIGNSKSHVTNMNITDPQDTAYLQAASKRKMSYYRQQSLKRAISHRAVLVTPKGEVAHSQYGDQYLDKAVVRDTLKKQQSKRLSFAATEDGDAALEQRCAVDRVSQRLSKSLSSAPGRTLAASLSKCVRPQSASVAGDAESVGAGAKVVAVKDLGMSRAISRIMTRGRATSMAVKQPEAPWNPAADASRSRARSDSDDGDIEAAPHMDDI